MYGQNASSCDPLKEYLVSDSNNIILWNESEDI